MFAHSKLSFRITFSVADVSEPSQTWLGEEMCLGDNIKILLISKINLSAILIQFKVLSSQGERQHFVMRRENH